MRQGNQTRGVASLETIFGFGGNSVDLLGKPLKRTANIAPETPGLEDDYPFKTAYFQVLCLFWGD